MAEILGLASLLKTDTIFVVFPLLCHTVLPYAIKWIQRNQRNSESFKKKLMPKHLGLISKYKAGNAERLQL